MRRAKEDEKQGKLPSKPFLALPWSLRVSPRTNISILFWLKNRTNGHCNKFLFWLVCTRVVCVCVKIRGCTYLSLWVWRLEVTSGIFFIFFIFLSVLLLIFWVRLSHWMRSSQFCKTSWLVRPPALGLQMWAWTKLRSGQRGTLLTEPGFCLQCRKVSSSKNVQLSPTFPLSSSCYLTSLNRHGGSFLFCLQFHYIHW